MGGSLLFTLASSLTPPSLSSSLLHPSLCCITSRGGREERSEACSSHLVNCFPCSSLPYCTTPRICTIILLWDAILWEKLFFFSSCFRRHSKSWFLWKGDSCFSNFLPIIQCFLCDIQILFIILLWLLLCVSTGVVKIGLLLVPQLPNFGEGSSVWNLTVVELKRGRNLRRCFDSEERSIISCGAASSLLQRERSHRCSGRKGSLMWDTLQRGRKKSFALGQNL